MNDQYPQEAEGWITDGPFSLDSASFRLVEDFRVTRHELEVLARHYLGDVRVEEYRWAAYETTCSTGQRERAFGLRRLGTIERILGEDVLDKVLEPVEEYWNKEFEELKDFLATTVKCEVCGKEFLREVEYQVTCLDCPSPDA